jgi:hypothetical protein
MSRTRMLPEVRGAPAMPGKPGVPVHMTITCASANDDGETEHSRFAIPRRRERDAILRKGSAAYARMVRTVQSAAPDRGLATKAG